MSDTVEAAMINETRVALNKLIIQQGNSLLCVQIGER